MELHYLPADQNKDENIRVYGRGYDEFISNLAGTHAYSIMLDEAESIMQNALSKEGLLNRKNVERHSKAYLETVLNASRSAFLERLEGTHAGEAQFRLTINCKYMSPEFPIQVRGEIVTLEIPCPPMEIYLSRAGASNFYSIMERSIERAKVD
ncbi:MAG: hypothetical protein ACE5FT_01935 [Candidatus Nanoarchaeia archaeon]